MIKKIVYMRKIMEINETLEHFSRFVEGFIFNDIQRSIVANTNFLTSLGLVSYTEFIGGLITGNGGKGRHSEKNFYAAYNRLGEDYKKFNRQIIEAIKKKDGTIANFYNVVRCGLVHEFFIKAPSIIAKNNYSKEAPGIGWSNGRIAIANNNCEVV